MCPTAGIQRVHGVLAIVTKSTPVTIVCQCQQGQQAAPSLNSRGQEYKQGRNVLQLRKMGFTILIDDIEKCDCVTMLSYF